jgi:hypothetical protein
MTYNIKNMNSLNKTRSLDLDHVFARELFNRTNFRSMLKS